MAHLDCRYMTYTPVAVSAHIYFRFLLYIFSSRYPLSFTTISYVQPIDLQDYWLPFSYLSAIPSLSSSQR